VYGAQLRTSGGARTRQRLGAVRGHPGPGSFGDVTHSSTMRAGLVLAPPRWVALFTAPLRRVRPRAMPAEPTIDPIVDELFARNAADLVRLARLFVDDRTAAEDLVQEAFIRLARSVHRVQDRDRIDAYLRSIVLNLARDHTRRGLVSLRHRPPKDELSATAEDEVVLRDDQRVVLEAVRRLPRRQRDCVVLRYFSELGIDDIADTLGLSRNSVKTHLGRGLAALERDLGAER
jgi:RNA polymerase sigma-70 factor (sigma-E family)